MPRRASSACSRVLLLLYVGCMQHYIFPSGGDGLYLVVDEKSNFRESNFQKAMAVLQVSQLSTEIDTPS